MDSIWDRIRHYSRRGIKVRNLAYLISDESLYAIHEGMDGDKAVGIDGVTKEEYEAKLDQNIATLVERLKKGAYYPKPSRRVYIDKPGTNKKRPLGISCYEDKLVENRIAEILTNVYEPKFMPYSYGFRPKKSCHKAIQEVLYRANGLCSYVVEADIRSFFDTMSHDWLMEFLKHDIADRKFLEIVRRFLKAGRLEDAQYYEGTVGSPQGNGASPVLANVYLHYALDLWFEKIIKKNCKGEAFLIRYADDFVGLFQYEEDAKLFYQELPGRFAKFGLELAEEKTRIIEFGRFAEDHRNSKGLGKPETFDFLGFTFYCGKNRTTKKFIPKVKTSAKKTRSKLAKFKQWLKENRHKSVKWIMYKVTLSLQGYYQYYCVTGNLRNVEEYLYRIKLMIFKWLNRRSQRRSYTWEQYVCGVLKTFELPEPRLKVNIYKLASA